MTNKMPKGYHEKAMEKARELLNQGVGMTEIMAKTNLEPEDITKERNKMEAKLDDKN